MPKISTATLYTAFAALAAILFFARAALWPDVPIAPINSAMNFVAGLTLGWVIHDTLIAEIRDAGKGR